MKTVAGKFIKTISVFFIAAIFLIPFLGIAQAETLETFSLFPGERGAIGDYRLYIQNFYFFSIGAAALIATVLIMIGGMIWVTSAGNQSRVAKAKEYISQSIIGLIILMGAYTLLQVINPQLVQLQLPGTPELGSFGPCVRLVPPGRPGGKLTYDHTCAIEDLIACDKTAGNVNVANAESLKGRTCVDICKTIANDGSCEIKEVDVCARYTGARLKIPTSTNNVAEANAFCNNNYQESRLGNPNRVCDAQARPAGKDETGTVYLWTCYFNRIRPG